MSHNQKDLTSCFIKSPTLSKSINFKNDNVEKCKLPLYIGNPKYTDIKQGTYGTCWFLSALASYIKPGHNDDVRIADIKKIIKPLMNGQYLVFLGCRWIYVDAYVPPGYINGNQIVLWPILFEKAMLSIKGENMTKYTQGFCDHNIEYSKGEFKVGADGLMLILNIRSIYRCLHDEHANNYSKIELSELFTLINMGCHILANTNLMSMQRDPKIVQKYGLVRNHCYAILKIYTTPGSSPGTNKFFVVLYNPWGSNTKNGSLFTLSWWDFLKVFIVVHHTGLV